MKGFKEWLSDYLRYFMLALAALLVFILAMTGIGLYRNAKQKAPQNVVEILTESESVTHRKETEEPSEAVTESRAGETEGFSESDTAKTPENGGTEQTASETSGRLQPDTEAGSAGLAGVTAIPGGSAQTTQPGQIGRPQAQTQTGTETETETETQTEAETETEPQPVYMTLTGSCYIRSGPGYEYDVIGEYMYGTVVQVLDDSSGWYKVQIDGMTGYMGSRFFH